MILPTEEGLKDTIEEGRRKRQRCFDQVGEVAQLLQPVRFGEQ